MRDNLLEMPRDNPFQNDLFDRKTIAENFMKIFEADEEGIILSIDSAWGTGNTLDSYGNKAFRFADLASRGKPRQLAGQHPQVRRHDTGRTRRGDRTVHCDRVHARPSARRRRPAGDQKHRAQRSQSHSGDPCTASGPRRRALDRATSSYAFYR